MIITIITIGISSAENTFTAFIMEKTRRDDDDDDVNTHNNKNKSFHRYVKTKFGIWIVYGVLIVGFFFFQKCLPLFRTVSSFYVNLLFSRRFEFQFHLQSRNHLSQNKLFIDI